MITENEILKGYPVDKLSIEQQDNLANLLIKINMVRQRWAKPMHITSGFRSKDDHIRVYKELAQKRGQEFDAAKIPWGSQHLKCAAVDVLDRDGSLYEWCEKNETWLKSVGLWLEKKDDQPRVHFQINKYGSYVDGKSIFFNV